jgi:transcription antitermination factor NusG
MVGEAVQIIDEMFNDFKGAIEEVNEDKYKLKATLKILK